MCIYIHVEEEADDKKLQEKQKRKVLQSSIVQELKNEYLDLPEDVHVSNYNYNTSNYCYYYPLRLLQNMGSGLRSRKEMKEEQERET